MNAPSSARAAAPTPAQVNVIRLALFSGALMLGAAAWFVTKDGSRPGGPGNLQAVAIGFYALLAGAVIGAIVVKQRMLHAPEWRSQVSLAIVGWALCEGAALLGGVYFLLTGVPIPYVIGMVVFAAALLLLSPAESTQR